MGRSQDPDLPRRHAEVVARLLLTGNVEATAAATGYSRQTVRAIAWAARVSILALREKFKATKPVKDGRQSHKGQQKPRHKVQHVIEVYERHRSLRKAGEELGLSPEGVRQYLLKANYQSPPIAPAVCGLCAACGEPIYVRGRLTCSDACRALRQGNRMRKWSDDELLELFRRMRPCDVIRECGMSPPTVYRRHSDLKKRGLL